MRIGKSSLQNGVTILALVLLIASCKSELGGPDTTAACASGNAQLFVGEGYLHLACGCAEGNNLFVLQGNTATCTVNLGTRLIFHFTQTRNRHQIVGSGTPSLGTSSVVDPNDSSAYPLTPFVPAFPQSGNYDFHDAFNPSVTGRIVVL